MSNVNPAIREGLEILFTGARNASERPRRQIAGRPGTPTNHTTIGVMNSHAAHLFNLLCVHQRVLQINSDKIRTALIGTRDYAILQTQRTVIIANVNGLGTELKRVLAEQFGIEYECEYVVLTGWRVAIPDAIYLLLPEELREKTQVS